MSAREFIGSRYVPIIVGEWDNSKTYEPLMVVTYQGNSYTSRQYVPVGVEITNQEFWALTGNYNAQVEQYRQEVKTEKSRAETAEQTLQTNVAKNTSDICPDVLFIGDSYMVGLSPDGNLTPFATIVKNKLEQSSNRHAYIVCKSGYSFASGNWLSLLTEWVNNQTKETLDRIGNIYICGGTNDIHYSGHDIEDAQNNFFNYCHTKFINARYTVFFIGASRIGEKVNADISNINFVKVINTYMYNSHNYGYSFINGSGIIKFNKYLSSDSLHPNQDGQIWLAVNLLNIINGGNNVFTYGHPYPGITLFNGVPDFQNNGDNYKLVSTGSSFKFSIFNPNNTSCAGDSPWYGYDISNCIGNLIFDTSGVSQNWENKTLEICTLPNEAMYQAPVGWTNIVRTWPVNIKYKIASGKQLPTGVDANTFFTDSGTLMIHGNKVYLNLKLITPLRASNESEYLNLPISQLIFTYVTHTDFPATPGR